MKNFQLDANERRKYSEVVHSAGHVDCPACEGALTMVTESYKLTPDMLFKNARKSWLESRKFGSGGGRCRYVAPRTLHDFEQYLDALGRMFDDLVLQDIHQGHLRQYQELRAAGKLGSPTCEKVLEVGPNKINQELGILIRMLKRAGLWQDEHTELYARLQSEERDVSRAMTPEEQQRLLQVQAGKQAYQTVYWYTLVALRTTASTCEMQALKLGDCSLTDGVLMIRRENAKNKYRIRTIPLTEDAHWALQQLIARAKGLGASAPFHYVFPFRTALEHWDVTKPMSDSSLRKPWYAARAEADLNWVRMYDLRHSAITRLAEAGVPSSVILSMAGHVSRKMQDHYTHISESAKRRAVLDAMRGTIYNHLPLPEGKGLTLQQ
jgi:integrase